MLQECITVILLWLVKYVKGLNKIEGSQAFGSECNEYSQKHLYNGSLVITRSHAKLTEL